MTILAGRAYLDRGVDLPCEPEAREKPDASRQQAEGKREERHVREVQHVGRKHRRLEVAEVDSGVCEHPCPRRASSEERAPPPVSEPYVVGGVDALIEGNQRFSRSTTSCLA